jgi:hypothetical protein
MKGSSKSNCARGADMEACRSMTQPRTTEVTPTREGARVTREAYHQSSDMFVSVESVDSKSRAVIFHPLHGRITVPCTELRG